MAHPRRAVALLLIVLTLPAGAGGCARDAQTPRRRLGALPFPGLLTLYTVADPEQLGRHRYGRWPRLFQRDEKERGIVYTTRGGFLDVAHVRMTVDTTHYCTRRIRRAMARRQANLALRGPNNAVFHVTLHYPSAWQDLPAPERTVLADELAMRTGQRLAYLMMTWHEVITWFGYRTVFFIDESPSAFTWDDTMSHVVGLRVAERAMRHPAESFDDAVTAALAAELRRLGAVTPVQTHQAVRAVEGIWWASGRASKRQFNVGLREYVISTHGSFRAFPSPPTPGPGPSFCRVSTTCWGGTCPASFPLKSSPASARSAGCGGICPTVPCASAASGTCRSCCGLSAIRCGGGLGTR